MVISEDQVTSLLGIPVSCHDYQIVALVDTGASHSIISPRVLENCEEWARIYIKPGLGRYKFHNASGKEMKVVGLWDGDLRFPGWTEALQGPKFNHEFYVVEDLNDDCILGMDFTNKHKFTFHGGENKITYPYLDGVNTIQFLPTTESRQCNIIIENTFDLEHLSKDEQQQLNTVLDRSKTPCLRPIPPTHIAH